MLARAVPWRDAAGGAGREDDVLTHPGPVWEPRAGGQRVQQRDPGRVIGTQAGDSWRAQVGELGVAHDEVDFLAAQHLEI